MGIQNLRVYHNEKLFIFQYPIQFFSSPCPSPSSDRVPSSDRNSDSDTDSDTKKTRTSCPIQVISVCYAIESSHSYGDAAHQCDQAIAWNDVSPYLVARRNQQFQDA